MSWLSWFMLGLAPGIVLGLAVGLAAGWLVLRAPGDAASPPATPQPEASLAEEHPPSVIARRLPVIDWYEAVGAVQPREETEVEALVTARVMQVLVNPGDAVTKGDVLVVLDNRQLASRLAQAEEEREGARASVAQASQGVQAAQASFDRAAAHYRRIRSLFGGKAVAESELDQAEADYLRAQAGLEEARKRHAAAQSALAKAQEAVEEARIQLGYATIVAHESGEVLRRHVDPGGLAAPGKSLLSMRTGAGLRLEALVREGLIGRVRPGMELPLRIPALDLDTLGLVDEVQPSADPATRTFVVKAVIPPNRNVHPGMFGRLLIPLDQHEAVLLPGQAVRRVGQLETVRIKTADGAAPWRTVFVTTGQANATHVEILSGLTGGELVALPQVAPGATPIGDPDTANATGAGGNG
ncbi:MAG: efflux RND transporter periplasmic adaptor subunit [Desulfovibrio sp.]|nr:efflux RND transporter periplasmic adaptor subunit [Desulfovibrio sp.]